ncbi:MAG: holo-ACP synthase [Clostridia bacterium]|nr:holo-ACP synthase [Clostridia bacterium]
MCNTAGISVRGVGVDLCEIARMQALLDSGHSLRRMFTEEEQTYIRSKGASAAQTMAGLFAAKEAVLKALGVGLTIPMTDIVITHTELGQPVAGLHGKAAEKGGRILLSISHEAGMAAAFAVWGE